MYSRAAGGAHLGNAQSLYTCAAFRASSKCNGKPILEIIIIMGEFTALSEDKKFPSHIEPCPARSFQHLGLLTIARRLKVSMLQGSAQCWCVLPKPSHLQLLPLELVHPIASKSYKNFWPTSTALVRASSRHPQLHRRKVLS